MALKIASKTRLSAQHRSSAACAPNRRASLPSRNTNALRNAQIASVAPVRLWLALEISNSNSRDFPSTLGSLACRREGDPLVGERPWWVTMQRDVSLAPSLTRSVLVDAHLQKSTTRPISLVVTSSYSADNYGPMGGDAKLKIFGVGGGGGNALNRMISSGLQGVEGRGERRREEERGRSERRRRRRRRAFALQLLPPRRQQRRERAVQLRGRRRQRHAALDRIGAARGSGSSRHGEHAGGRRGDPSGGGGGRERRELGRRRRKGAAIVAVVPASVISSAPAGVG